VKKILEKARLILRNVYAALGAAVMPVLIHAAYGMREPDLTSYTVPIRGRVEPYTNANTDDDGRFRIYVRYKWIWSK
jgi:hypothetical protein